MPGLPLNSTLIVKGEAKAPPKPKSTYNQKCVETDLCCFGNCGDTGKTGGPLDAIISPFSGLLCGLGKSVKNLTGCKCKCIWEQGGAPDYQQNIGGSKSTGGSILFTQSPAEAWKQTQETLKDIPILGQLTDMTPCQPIKDMPPIPCLLYYL